MLGTSSPLNTNDSRSPSAFYWVLVPAVVMSLGWGLRGYIGGGPHGAMIPGALVSLILCNHLGYSISASAAVVAFAAIGIGFGGNMTYGQTLGLIRETETFGLGLAGTTLKGAIWGLLGGAMLGLGFAARHLALRHMVLALLLILVGITLGINFVNVPKLIYFSDPINKPRDESWAGLLCGAIAVLTYMQLRHSKVAWMPLVFGLYGSIGGAFGFGLGSLFLTLQANLSDQWNWLPCWKFMEFSFGFLFGASLGLGSLHLRDRLRPLGANELTKAPTTTEPFKFATPLQLIPSTLIVFGVYYAWNQYAELLFPELGSLGRSNLKWTATDVLVDFTGVGCLLLLLSQRWQTIAWQVAISMTIIATAIDWQRDLLPRGHIDWDESYRNLFIACMGLASILVVHTWTNSRAPKLMHLFLFAICVLMGVGYMMGLAHADIWHPAPEAVTAAGGQTAYLWQQYRGEVIVHFIFTALFTSSVCVALHELRIKNTTRLQQADTNN